MSGGGAAPHDTISGIACRGDGGAVQSPPLLPNPSGEHFVYPSNSQGSTTTSNIIITFWSGCACRLSCKGKKGEQVTVCIDKGLHDGLVTHQKTNPTTFFLLFAYFISRIVGCRETWAVAYSRMKVWGGTLTCFCRKGSSASSGVTRQNACREVDRYYILLCWRFVMIEC